MRRQRRRREPRGWLSNATATRSRKRPCQRPEFGLPVSRAVRTPLRRPQEMTEAGMLGRRGKHRWAGRPAEGSPGLSRRSAYRSSFLGDTFGTFDSVLVLGKLCPDLPSIPGRGSHQGVRPTLGKAHGVSLGAEKPAWCFPWPPPAKALTLTSFAKCPLKSKNLQAALVPGGPNYLH